MKKIMILGDLCLDIYKYGAITRLNPENYSRPLMRYTAEELHLGMAANVAASCASLGSKYDIQCDLIVPNFQTSLYQQRFDSLLNRHNINKIPFSFVKTPYYDIEKIRYIANDNYIFRMDLEPEEISYDRDDIKRFYNFILDISKDYDTILLSDYNKGIFTTDIALSINFISELSSKVRVLFDPKKEWFKGIKNLYAITPNRNEIKQTGMNVSQLSKYMDTIVINTLGEDGMFVVNPNGVNIRIDPVKANVIDPVGCGDVVLATLGVELCNGNSLETAAQKANRLAAKNTEYIGAWVAND